MKRREFIKSSALAAAFIASKPLNAKSKTIKSTVKSYREIGKTGLKMSDISFGTGGLPSSSLILRAIDRGINYFDTAPDYGPAEKYIGHAMKNIQRDKIIIASKFCRHKFYPGHLPLKSKKEDYIHAVNDSLKTLKTDYIDICFVHAIGEMSKNMEKEKRRLLNNEMLSAVEILKKDGKIKFLGVSSHGPDNMENLLLEAVRSGHFDLIMAAFNFMKFPNIPHVIKEAKNKGVGVIAMKTLAGAKDMNLDTGGDEFAPAAFKWVLKHSEVNGLVVTIKTVSDLNRYLSASGESFTKTDKRILDTYSKIFTKEYCRTGCNECESSCPYDVQVASILRYKMYFDEYSMEKNAMSSYANLKVKANDCLDCKGIFCVNSCPYGLSVKDMMCDAHDKLSFYA